MNRLIPLDRRPAALTVRIAALIWLVAAAVGVQAAPGGPIGTLPLGRYVCELPGDATGAVGQRQPEADFTITHGSSYRTAGGPGTYLLTGGRLVFTAGPLRTVTYRRVSTSFLRRVMPDGGDGRLRCVRQGAGG